MKTIRQETLGKATLRLLQRKSDFAGIVILNNQIVQQTEGSDPNELWQRLCGLASESNPQYFGFDGARARFLRIFPKGFESTAYFERERGYKLEAKKVLDSAAPVEAALNGRGMGKAVLATFQKSNLLDPRFELPRISDVLRSSSADAFIRTAAQFTIEMKQSSLSSMREILAKHDAAKWTIASYLPFLWDPARHMFLKPQVTQDFAERVGHPFRQEYQSTLELSVYQSLLNLASHTEQEISSLAGC
ncbi:MAG: hypothetical protein WD270_05415 [Acetobacterales bacterium]